MAIPRRLNDFSDDHRVCSPTDCFIAIPTMMMMMSNPYNFLPPAYGQVPFHIPTVPPLVQQPYPPFYPPSIDPWSYQYPHRTSRRAVLKLYDLGTSNESDVIRLVLTFGDVAFKEKRLNENQWMETKQCLPILRLASKTKIFQRDVILRYLARELNIYGTNSTDQVVVDTVLDIVRSFDEYISPGNRNTTNAEQVKQHRQEFLARHGQSYLERLEQVFETYPHRGPFYLGSRISLADLIVYHTLNDFIQIDAKLIDQYSHLKAARHRLSKHSQLNHFYQQLEAKRQRAKDVPRPSEMAACKSPAVPVPVNNEGKVTETVEQLKPALSVVMEEVPELIDSEALLA